MKGAIFDLDGTLIDSMGVWEKIDDALLRSYGKEPDHAYREAITRLSFWEGAVYIIERYHLPKTPEQILAQIDAMAWEEYRYHIQLKPDVSTYLYYLSQQKIQLAVGTSCTEKLCHAVLENNQIANVFHQFVFANQIPNGKRSPAFFQACAQKMGLECKECTVFEDSAFAAQSAQDAGCQTIGVYDSYSKKQFPALCAVCDRTIYSFRELLPPDGTPSPISEQVR